MKNVLLAGGILLVLFILVKFPEWRYYDIGPRAKYHCLIRAIDDDDVGSVRRLVNEGVSLNSLPSGTDPTWEDDNVYPLSEAIQRGNRQIIEMLLNSGADINKASALEVAAEKGDSNVVKLLISRGANINDYAGTSSALWTSVYMGNTSTVKRLLDNGAVPSVEIINMAQQRRPKMVSMLKAARSSQRRSSVAGKHVL